MGHCTEEQAREILVSLEEMKKLRVDQMPTEEAALDVFMAAYTRLKDLGWREIIYVPKDGTTFEVIEPGSTGIFRCHWQQTPPRGSFWIEEDGGSPSHPVLWRPPAQRRGE